MDCKFSIIYELVWNIGQYLQLTPAEEIVFRREDGETTGMLVMNNTASCNVAYKVFFFTRKENLVTSKLHFQS